MRQFLLFLLFLPLLLQAKTVYITPIGGLEVEKLFYDPYAYRDQCAKPFCVLREALEAAGYKVKFSVHGENLEDFTAFISLTDEHPELLKNLAKVPRKRCFLHMFESPIIMPSLYRESLSNHFGKVYILSTDLVDNVNRFQMYYVQPNLKMVEETADFAQKKLCAIIAGNKDSDNPKSLYRERKQVISFFTRNYPNDLDLYGPDWSGYALWRGQAKSKWETLKNYKFSFCYENVRNQRGYVTEKIFDCMVAGCVPVYWGASNIADYVPPTCFIARQAFASDQELYVFLKNMDATTYQTYLDAIRDYFASPQAQLFSIESFVDLILKEVSHL